MTGTLKGHIKSVSKEEATLANNLSDEANGEIVAPPHMRVEQLKAQHREIKEARIQLEQECAELDREIVRREDGGCAHAMAHDVNRRIIADDEALPHFARASQNIAAAMALLRGLPELATPEDRWDHREISTLLERAAMQQAESSPS